MVQRRFIGALSGVTALLLLVGLAVVAFSVTGGTKLPDLPDHGPLPAATDVLTVVASASSRVSIIAETVQHAAYGLPAGNETRLLQLDYHHVLDGPHTQGPEQLQKEETLPDNAKKGESYLVFQSFDRSGACVSLAYRYRGENQNLTLTYVTYGLDPPGGFQLAGHDLKVPHTVSYAQVLASLNPIGGPVYSPVSGESGCPGP